LAEAIWSSDCHRFETTKFQLAKLEGVAGMRIGTSRGVIAEKTGIPRGRLGALTQCKDGRNWLMLVNSKDLVKLPRDGKLRAEEIAVHREDLVKLCLGRSGNLTSQRS